MSKTPQALLITDKSNIAYLSNFTGSAGFMLLTKNKQYLFTDFRYLERAKDTIKKGITLIDNTRMWRNPEILEKNWQSILRKHNIKTLGIEESNLTISKFKKFKQISHTKIHPIHFQDCSGTIEARREIKSKAEIELTTKSQRINEKALEAIKKIVHQSLAKNKALREIDLVWKIKEFGRNFGAEDISFEPIVAFGKNSSRPHHLSNLTLLKKGDLILIDMGVKYHGYCSDMSRMIFTAKPTPEQKEIYNLVLKAQENGIKNIKAGITGRKADQLSRDIIKQAGFGEKYGHAGGHGIGLDIHESPSLSDSYTKKLRENSIITIEPGIYLEGKFGVRIEDMVIVKKSGVINLTKSKKTL